ncbi:hypothetical protein [Streptomyces tardus]|nr:hypothetical protein [Streptomyces tardus]
METPDSLVVDIDDAFWACLLIPLVAIAGLWFTFRSRHCGCG